MEKTNLVVWICLLVIRQQLVTVQALSGHVCYERYTTVGRRTTSCGVFGWSRCTRYLVSYHTRERCCDGWRQASGGSCTIFICSHQYPCYPGDCVPPNGCTCAPGYGGDQSFASRCLTFTSDNPKPTIDSCEHTFAQVGPMDNKQMFHIRSSGGNVGSMDVYWINKTFNWMEFNLTSSYNYEANISVRPKYVSASGVGIIRMSVDVLHTRVNKNGGAAYLAYKHEYLCTNGTSKDTPIRPTAVCSIKERNYPTSPEHGDNLTVTFLIQSGGFRNISNPDTGIYNRTDYFVGRQTQQKILFRLDFSAPLYCSSTSVKCPNGALEPLYLDKDVTKDPINVTWKGWFDEISGIAYYNLDLFLLSPNNHGDLVETTPLQPVLSFKTNASDDTTVLSHEFTPPESGMYSILLKVSDHANNSRIARRLVLFDDTSQMTISKPNANKAVIAGDGGMYVTTAVAETGYRWQTSRNASSTYFTLEWRNHFRNLLHENNGLLRKVLPFPTQYQDIAQENIKQSSVVEDLKLDDREGRRTMEPINNINGVVKFQFKDVLTADRTEPTFGWQDLPLGEQYSFSRNLTNFLRLWIKATDVMNNTIADYTEVYIDNTPPIFSREKLTINVHNSSFIHASIVTIDAVDLESGVHKLGFDIHVENQTEPLKSGTAIANRNNDTDACRTDTNCRCSLDQCFLADQTLYLDNCWFMVQKEELESSATVTIHVYNQALLKTSFSLPIKKLSDLNGLGKYSGPTNIRVVKELPYGVRLAWDLPPTASCYGQADIVILLYRADNTSSSHHIYNAATTYDLVGLEPDMEYNVSLNLRYDGANFAALSFQFQTAPQKNDLSDGAIGGIVAGTVVIIGLLIGLFAVLLRRGHVEPVRKSLQSVSARYQTTEASESKRVSIIGGFSRNDADRESLYINPDLDVFDESSHSITRDDVAFKSLLTSGNFADIYLAHLHSNKSSVQLVAKVLKDGHSPHDERLMRAKINFISLVVGHHENIARFVGAVISQSELGPFMIYEYYSEGTLKNYLKESKKNFNEEIHGNLFRFGLDIVRGMTYLAEKKIVHRRLAARNILLDSALCAKIHGFGPQPEEQKRNVSKSPNTDNKERIPIRWCAPECFKSTLEATEKSDVWSYGIVLWEIFSLGQNPYGNIQTRDLPARVKAGEKMTKPDLCDDKWYGLMKRAWNLTPIMRPPFKVIMDELDGMFDASFTNDYYMYSR